MKKAQAALEYLSIYGWAFVSIMATIAALSYFGFFSLGEYVSQCSFTPGISCDEFAIQPEELRLRLTNAYGTDLTNVNLTVTSQKATSGSPITCSNLNQNWPDQSTIQFDCSIPSANYAQGTQYIFDAELVFQQTGETRSLSTLGEIIATAQ